MKLIHLSDLHLGKRLNEFSLLEDQKYILAQILTIIQDERPDAVLIAGDIYDKSVPPTDAIALFDDFLAELANHRQTVCIISGNHDSAERLAFANRLIAGSGIYFAPVYADNVTPITRTDRHGRYNIYLLPFVKPAEVRRFFPDAEITSYTDALRTVVEAMHIDPAERNILVTHQFVTGAQRSDSEEISVGGSDNVDAAVFDGFDYVALGHIHGAQQIGSEKLRYCGTPLKYSFSETKHEKSVTVAEIEKKGDLSIRTVPLRPLREMREIKGTYEALTAKAFYEGTDFRDAYTHITLTDENDIPDAIGKLRVIYRRLMKLDYDNLRTRHTSAITGAEAVETKKPLTLFSELYELQNNAPMSDEQTAWLEDAISRIWEARS